MHLDTSPQPSFFLLAVTPLGVTNAVGSEQDGWEGGKEIFVTKEQLGSVFRWQLWFPSQNPAVSGCFLVSWSHSLLPFDKGALSISNKPVPNFLVSVTSEFWVACHR